MQSGDVTSWKAGMYGKSFSAGQRNWVCVHPCVRVLCVEGEGQLITSFTRNTAWVAERNRQNYPRAVLAHSQGDGATNSASSHAVAPFPPKSVDGFKAGSNTATKSLSKNNLLL